MIQGRLIGLIHKIPVGFIHIQAEAPVGGGGNLQFFRHIPRPYQHIEIGVLPAAPVRVVIAQV